MRALYPPGEKKTLGVLCVEEAEEGCVLGEEGLDLGDAGAGPVLHPGLAEIVLDLVKAAFTHGRKYRHPRRTAPWAERLIRGMPSPILRGRERPVDHQSALWTGWTRPRGDCGRDESLRGRRSHAPTRRGPRRDSRGDPPRTCWGWRAATVRSPRWRRLHWSGTRRSSACPSERATTSRATSASTATTVGVVAGVRAAPHLGDSADGPRAARYHDRRRAGREPARSRGQQCIRGRLPVTGRARATRRGEAPPLRWDRRAGRRQLRSRLARAPARGSGRRRAGRARDTDRVQDRAAGATRAGTRQRRLGQPGSA